MYVCMYVCEVALTFFKENLKFQKRETEEFSEFFLINEVRVGSGLIALGYVSFGWYKNRARDQKLKTIFDVLIFFRSFCSFTYFYD